ncbi:MAG: hypothetical protein E7288_01885 [Lachnospiraceae bacterium]|nr:hypothetical protein [Lachnospiraceae bacterium]
MGKKKQIYYARTYRRIELDAKACIIFACLLVLPVILLLLFFMDELTALITDFGVMVLSSVIPREDIVVKVTDYAFLHEMHYIDLPMHNPGMWMIVGNLIVCLLTLILLRVFKRTGRPLAIYATFAIMIHIVSCAFFAFAAKYFPYTMADYSELYMKQQIGIWITFALLAGLVVSFMGAKHYGLKAFTFYFIMLYALVFGTIRYVLFLYLLHQFSALYMALLFFVVGPTFDFSYFVIIYAFFVNKTIRNSESGESKEIWKWS